jgi:hypothetical protein
MADQIVPTMVPQQSRGVTVGRIRRQGIDDEFALLGVRGYYLRTMGKPKINDRGMYDDAIILVTPTAYARVQMRGDGVGQLTRLTSFAAALSLSISVLAFVGWEIAGMIIRSKVNIALARAVNSPTEFEWRVREHREKMASLMRYFQPTWAVVISVAAGGALIAFGIMVSALLHGAWVAL